MIRERILKYLVAGVKPAQIATLVGRTPGYISQLMGEESFKERYNAMLSEELPSMEDSLETRYEALESELINGVRDSIANSELPAITKALETVSNIRDRRHERKNPRLLGQVSTVNIVQLALPQHAIPQAPVLELNSRSEIVSINDKPLAPLSADGVRTLFAGLKASKEASAPKGVEDDSNDSEST